MSLMAVSYVLIIYVCNAEEVCLLARKACVPKIVELECLVLTSIVKNAPKDARNVMLRDVMIASEVSMQMITHVLLVMPNAITVNKTATRKYVSNVNKECSSTTANVLLAVPLVPTEIKLALPVNNVH
jgi:hypothetical protein